MAELAAFESPVVKTYPTSSGAALTLIDASATEKTIVRAGTDTAAAAEIDVGFGSSRRDGAVLVCGQRPDEWMLLGTAEANRAFVERLDTGGHVSVIDHTHSRALFRLSGDGARATLEKVCSLDWTDAMTPDGAVASASVAKIICDIVREDLHGVASYLIACDRSFGQYLFDALLDAGDEFEVAVG